MKRMHVPYYNGPVLPPKVRLPASFLNDYHFIFSENLVDPKLNISDLVSDNFYLDEIRFFYTRKE